MSDQEREYVNRIIEAYCAPTLNERLRLLVVAELFKPRSLLEGVFTS